MRASELENVKSRLQQRRRAILDANVRTAADIDQLRSAERDPELEEASQSEQEQYNLTQLGELARAELAQIDASLRRLEAGTYGICRSCEEPIAASRLRALPFATECAECASRREEAAGAERRVSTRPGVTGRGA